MLPTRAELISAMPASSDDGQNMLAGTYLGLVEKLDYLQRLGINAVELLPVQEFNELEYYQVRSLHHSQTILALTMQGH